MKRILALSVLMFSLNSMAQVSEATTGLTLSPFATATKLLESATATIASPFASTSGTLGTTLDARGVAGKEQMKDELVALNDDIVSGKVRTIEEVRQEALKELFAEISENKAQMEEINNVVQEGNRLHRIATSVTIILLAE